MYQIQYLKWEKLTPKGQRRQKVQLLSATQREMFTRVNNQMTLEEIFTCFTGIQLDGTIRNLKLVHEYTCYT